MKKLLIIVILVVFSILPVMAQDSLGIKINWNQDPYYIGGGESLEKESALSEITSSMDWPVSIWIDNQGRCWYAAQTKGAGRLTISNNGLTNNRVPNINVAYHVTGYAGKIVLNAGGIYVFEPNTFKQLGYLLGHYVTWSTKKNNQLFCLASTHNEQSQRLIGVYQFDLNEFTEIFNGLSETKDFDRGGFEFPGRSLVIDNAGRYWAGDYNGLHRYDPETDKLEHISSSKLNGPYVRGLHYDSATNVLFIGTNRDNRSVDVYIGGLVIWDLKTDEIQKINWEYDIGFRFSPEVLGNTGKFAALGRLLFIAGASGSELLVYHLDQKRFLFTVKMPDPFYRIRDIVADQENKRIWIATQFNKGGGGITYFNVIVPEDSSKLIFPPSAPKVSLASADTSWVDSTQAIITATFNVESDTGVYVNYKIMEDNVPIKEGQLEPVLEKSPPIIQSIEVSFTALVETDYNFLFCAYDSISGLYSDWSETIILFRLDALVPEPPPYVPTELTLYQNYPNPFNPKTTIEYYLPTPSHVRINVYNVLGQLIIRLVDENKEAGPHDISWNGFDAFGNPMSSGIYIYKLQTKDFTQSKKMLLLR